MASAAGRLRSGERSAASSSILQLWLAVWLMHSIEASLRLSDCYYAKQGHDLYRSLPNFSIYESRAERSSINGAVPKSRQRKHTHDNVLYTEYSVLSSSRSYYSTDGREEAVVSSLCVTVHTRSSCYEEPYRGTAHVDNLFMSILVVVILHF